MKKHARLSILQISGLLLSVLSLLALPNTHAQAGLQPVSKSRITAVALPPSAQLITEPEMLRQVNAQLDGFAQKLNGKCGAPEVIGWLGDKRQVSAVMSLASSELKKAGWNYEDQDAGSEAGSSLKLMYARRQGQLVAGFWAISGDGVILAWCSLTSNAAPTQPAAPVRSLPAPSSGAQRAPNALEGLYVGYIPSFTPEIEYRDNRIAAGSGSLKEHIIFFPDGEYYWRLPAYGLVGFNKEESKRDFGWWWGKYIHEGQRVKIEAGYAHMYAQWAKDGLRLKDRVYKRVCSCSGMRISGTYHRPGWELEDVRLADNYITFHPDGRFDEKAFLHAARINRDGYYGQEDPTSGSGTYTIDQNTVELRYSSGYVTRVTFYVHKEDETKRSPDPIVIGVYARWFRLKNR